MDHPVQPLEVNEHGIVRFKGNSIVRFILERGGIDLNTIAARSFSKEDRQQFAQLIGYSLSGYSELSYVDDKAFARAQAMLSAPNDPDKEYIKQLEQKLLRIKEALRYGLSELYGKHPDDFMELDER
jgi:hypothetical protein